MEFTTQELATKLNGQLFAPANLVVKTLGNLESCEQQGVASLVLNSKNVKKLATYSSPFFVITNQELPKNIPHLYINKNKTLLIDAINTFFPEEPPAAFISEAAHIAPNAQIGSGTTIYPGVFIGENVKVGNNTTIHPNVVVYADCVIGNNCLIHANTTIGSDGFGFITDSGINKKVPHKGIVRIEDNVEIGANTTIDRATLGETLIGEGTKIDNKVQIAHNVIVGKNCLLAGASNIAGSATLEDNVILAGGAGVADNTTIGQGSVITAYTVAIGIVPAGTMLHATPTGEPYREAMKKKALYNKLPDLFKSLSKPIQNQ